MTGLRARFLMMRRRCDALLSDFTSRIQTLPDDEITHRHLYRDTWRKLVDLRDEIRELEDYAERVTLSQIADITVKVDDTLPEPRGVVNPRTWAKMKLKDD